MNSPLKWVGGKSKLATKLINLFPRHEGYVEVFGGGASVLFNKHRVKWEILNDFDSNLMNFWEVVKNKHEDFVNSFDYTLVSRETFNKYKEKYQRDDFKEICNEVERAHIFYYLVKAGFGSSMITPNFGTGKDRNRLRIEDIEKDINEAYTRLKTVTIENDSFEKLIPRYDSGKTFFFMDPPYRSLKPYEVGVFKDEQYLELAKICKNIKGKFMITINDDDFVRETFKDFNIIDNSVFYSMSKEKGTRREFNELIITNYNILNI